MLTKLSQKLRCLNEQQEERILINLCRKVCYFLRDTVEFSRKNTFRVYFTVSNSRNNTFHVYKSILRERLFAIAAIGLYLICVVILCSDEDSGRIYSAFRSSPGASITVSLSPGPQIFGEQGSKNMFVHVFSCECVCLCVKIKSERV